MRQNVIWLTVCLVVLMLVLPACSATQQSQSAPEASTVSGGSSLSGQQARSDTASDGMVQLTEQIETAHTTLVSQYRGGIVCAAEMSYAMDNLSKLCDSLYYFYKDAVIHCIEVGNQNLAAAKQETSLVWESQITAEAFGAYCAKLEETRKQTGEIAVSVRQTTHFGAATLPSGVAESAYQIALSNAQLMQTFFRNNCTAADQNADGISFATAFEKTFAKYSDADAILKAVCWENHTTPPSAA